MLATMKFEPYSPETLRKYAPLIAQSKSNVNDISVGSFLMWNEGVHLAFCEVDGCLITVQDICGEPSFSYPFGGDTEAALDALLAYVSRENLPLKFYGANESTLREICRHPKLSRLMYNYERKWSDYIYDAAEMETFAGKKFSGQRNHINKFRSLYGEPDFRQLSPEMLPALRALLCAYAKEHPAPGYEECEEYLHTQELLEAYFSFPLIGGALFVDGAPVSLTIGEMQGEHLIIHVEKALTRYTGVYPTTFNSFVRYARSRYPQLATVNREDDAGDVGLRTSKLQYKPILLCDKYLVKVNSPLFGLSQTPVLYANGVVLSEITASDKATYRALCTDEENNRLWGYDYKTDPEITGEIDDDTFYDMVSFDRSIGEGISFAIRESGIDHPLVGEVILYNFTYNGTAELGARLMPAMHGKGLGSTAFRLAADWAENELGVSLRAKCYRENTTSQKMILSAGFVPDGEDDTFFYFCRK